MTEAALTKQVVRELKRRKLWHCKLHGGPMQRAGLPDFLVVIDGRAIFLELKGDGGQVTPLQSVTMQRLETAGAKTAVVRSLGDLTKALSIE
jgi:hypothetical protein